MCRFKQQEADISVDGGLKQSLVAEGAGSGKACPLARDSRLPADRPRHPGRGRFALQACLSFPAGPMHRVKQQEAERVRRVSWRAGLAGSIDGDVTERPLFPTE